MMSFEFPGYGLHLGNASMRREIPIVLGFRSSGPLMMPRPPCCGLDWN